MSRCAAVKLQEVRQRKSRILQLLEATAQLVKEKDQTNSEADRFETLDSSLSVADEKSILVPACHEMKRKRILGACLGYF